MTDLKKTLTAATLSPALFAAVLAAAPVVMLTAGCDSARENAAEDAADNVDETTGTTVIPGTPNATAEGVEDRREDMKANAEDAADNAMSKAEDAADTAKENVAEMADNTAGAGQVAMKQAESGLQQVQNYIDDGKLDLAETAMKSVEGMKSKLPAAMQTQVDTVRKALDSAKAMAAKAGGMMGK